MLCRRIALLLVALMAVNLVAATSSDAVPTGTSPSPGSGDGQREIAEGRMFASLLRVFESAEWDVIFVKMARVVVNYFTDMAFKMMFGTTGRTLPYQFHDLIALRGRYLRRLAEKTRRVSREVRQGLGDGLQGLSAECWKKLSCNVGSYIRRVDGFSSALETTFKNSNNLLLLSALTGMQQGDCQLSYPDCDLL
ncbi:uncharacterized protein LOC135366814 [Ornithodoros turicata]|uniref:uncharacterized protein LOC135366814 n=1 Tax=Ornithodoros turicata TaxID=34597 RepID=UPI0031390354